MTSRTLAVAISGCPLIVIDDTFERHVSTDVRTLTGSSRGGRWGPPGAYPVLYLGRPTASVVVEAYRHLVDNVEGMRPELVKPRRLLECRVRVRDVLDLRGPDARTAVGLTLDDLTSDPGSYAACQTVGQVAHQLGLHGVLAPAATGLGETLALFEHHLRPQEYPTISTEVEWQHLPADPRVPRPVP